METIIPVKVMYKGELSAIYEDGILVDCYHINTESGTADFNIGMDNEYTIGTDICKTCGAWYDIGDEDWIES